jgi:putative PIN family toxin of toxin-antitoxin system
VRLVLDTNVLVAAQRSGAGASAKILNAARSGKFTMLASAALFLEYEAVLTREEHLAAAGLERETVVAALNALATLVEPIDIRFVWRPIATDPDDDMVFEAALNGRADAIVTFETSVFEAAAKPFGVAVMTPGAAWRRITP